MWCDSERKTKEATAQVVGPAEIEDSDDEGDIRSYEPIDMLQDAGINVSDIAKLKEDGFATVGQLFQVSQRRLLTVKGISEAKMDKVGLWCSSTCMLNPYRRICVFVAASSSRTKGLRAFSSS